VGARVQEFSFLHVFQTGSGANLVYQSEERALILRKKQRVNGILRQESGKVIEGCKNYV
jgi:hypothetical protein